MRDARTPEVRLPPLPADEWDDRVRDALKALVPKRRRNPEGAGTAMSTLVRHPDLTEAYLGLGVYLMFRSTLPPRTRSLLVLRVAHRRDCAYQWVHHTRSGRDAGLTAAEIAGVRRGELPDEFDQALLDAVDELDEKSGLSDRTWSVLRARLDERQVMDLVFTVGGYVMTAMAYNSFGVLPEQEA